MLFNLNWLQPKHDVLSLAGFIAWLKTQDQNTQYDWHSTTDCLAARYLRAMKYELPSGHGYGIIFANPKEKLHCLAYGLICSDVCGKSTYGAALERAHHVADGDIRDFFGVAA